MVLSRRSLVFDESSPRHRCFASGPTSDVYVSTRPWNTEEPGIQVSLNFTMLNPLALLTYGVISGGKTKQLKLYVAAIIKGDGGMWEWCSSCRRLSMSSCSPPIVCLPKKKIPEVPIGSDGN